MAEPSKTVSLSGWGRMHPQPCLTFRPERRRDLLSILADEEPATLIARGLGRSYGDTAVNGEGVIDQTRLDRAIAFDPETGVLECEAGMSLADVVDTYLPRGFFLPVTPGTKFVTVGGAIANDVHGKNHHCDGTFSRFVLEFDLLTASGEILRCSPAQNADVFWATVGGIGLTGILLSAKIQLRRVESAYILTDYRRCANLETALSAMAEHDGEYPYSVAWVDCLASGKDLGRSVLMYGKHATPGQLPAVLAADPYRVPRKRGIPVPFDFPEFALNPLSIKAFNTVFYGKHADARDIVVDYDKYFYPLDGLLHWNRMYGKRGFAQYQVALPPEQVAGLIKLLERLSAARRASFLAVLKTFGGEGEGLLSFPKRGYTLALDIPNHGQLAPFLAELDRIVLDHGGRLYLAKDATTSPEALAQMYPRLDAFRAVKERLDPQERFASAMSRRLGLTRGKEASHAG